MGTQIQVDPRLLFQRLITASQSPDDMSAIFKDPVLPFVHCTLGSLGDHFCDAENSEAFVCGENRTL